MEKYDLQSIIEEALVEGNFEAEILIRRGSTDAVSWPNEELQGADH